MGSFRPPHSAVLEEADETSASGDRLRLIADLLGVSTDIFTNGGQAPRDLHGAHELLEIWAELETHEARERLLTLARGLLNRG